nr:toprim domain-containing protein [Methylobacterium sp. L1A1]
MAFTLSEIAYAMNGDVRGRQVLCPGPGHSKKDRSLSIMLSSTSLKGWVCHSYAGDDWRLCEEYVAGHLGQPLDSWREHKEQRAPDLIKDMQRQQKRIEAERREAEDEARRQRSALAIWNAAGDPRGTLVETYLRSRNLDLPDDMAGEAIRFHPRCPWETQFVSAMVVPFRNIHTGEITGIHRIGLTADARKIDRKMLGTIAGAAVMLDPPEAVSLGLAIGEGVETGLAARQLGIRPVWALGSVDAIRSFPVLSGIEGLTILGETGDGGASERAGREVGTRWHRAGRAVEVIVPRVSGDLNDALQAGGIAA